MSYEGTTYRVVCDRGGLNASSNEELIPPEAMVPGSKNINSVNGGREKRGGTSKVFTPAITGTPNITGVYDYCIPGGAAFILLATGDGKIWQNSTTALKTGLTVDRFSSFETFDKEVVICNGADIPQVWDGSAASTFNIGNELEAPDVSTVALAEVAGPSSTPTLSLAGDGAGNLTNGAYNYKITYATASGETVGSAGAQITVVDAASDGKVTLVSIPISENELVTQRKIYRTISDGESYLLATTISNNTDTIYTDNLADSGLGAAIPTINRASAGNLGNGEYKYKATFVTSTGETGGSEECEITISDNTISGQAILTNIPVGGSGVTSRKIYRTIIDGSDYFLVTTLSDDSTTYTDNLADGGLGAALAAATATSIPSDWAGSSYPTQSKAHGRGNSSRLWFLGCSGTPYTVYASPNGSKDSLSDSEIVIFTIDTGDTFGIVGMTVLDDKLVCFGKRKAYIIDDADDNSHNWGYIEAPWKGGASSHRLVIDTPTDVVCMTDEGDIYSLRSAQKFGDYGHASLIRDSFIHKWIKDNVRMSYINHFHGLYDPVLRAIKIWVVRNGETECNTALVYFLDRGPAEGWIIHDNLTSISGYDAASAAVIRVGAGQYEVYAGDYSGFMWKTEQVATNDDSLGFYSGFTTPELDFGNPRTRKNFKQGFLVVDPQATEAINVETFVDGTSLGVDTFTVGTDKNYPFSIGANGSRIKFEVYNSTADEKFFISQILVDYKDLGARTE